MAYYLALANFFKYLSIIKKSLKEEKEQLCQFSSIAIAGWILVSRKSRTLVLCQSIYDLV